MQICAAFQWDPNRVFFMIPYLNFPIFWYGFFFALGYELEWLGVKRVLSHFLREFPAELSHRVMTQVTLWTTIGSVLGARLGYVLFYGLPHYLAHPLDIFNLRQGGLASHGAILGLMGVLWLLAKRFKKECSALTWVALVDILTIPVGLTGACIRLGNFMNQEITGKLTSMPWGVEFLHPADGIRGVVHPVQLYEGLAYLFIGLALIALWRRQKEWVGTGLFFGLGVMGIAFARFILEFFKVPQGSVLPVFYGLQMGQLLSIPLFVLGFLFFCRRRKEIDDSKWHQIPKR